MKQLKVFGVPWHVSHQYELAKLPFFESYSLLINPYRTWGERSRPLSPKMNYVTSYERGKYDLAILHVDQQCIEDKISKGRLFRELDERIKDIPKVVINHMTPFSDVLDSPQVIKKMKEMVGSNYMITNSYEAAKQWGWGHPVIHGLDVDEWLDLPKEPRAITVLSPAGMDKAYRRIFLNTVIRLLKDDWGLKFYWVGVDLPNFPSFDEYRNYLGRSLIFFNATWQSPRPRARTEAMLSGCCIVTTPYHDADTFIEHGVNGFLTSRLSGLSSQMDNPKETAALIADLLNNRYNEAVAIGQKGKETARRLFNSQNFASRWEEVLRELNLL